MKEEKDFHPKSSFLWGPFSCRWVFQLAEFNILSTWKSTPIPLQFQKPSHLVKWLAWFMGWWRHWINVYEGKSRPQARYCNRNYGHRPDDFWEVFEKFDVQILACQSGRGELMLYFIHPLLSIIDEKCFKAFYWMNRTIIKSCICGLFTVWSTDDFTKELDMTKQIA